MKRASGYDRDSVVELLPYMFFNDLTGLTSPLERAPDMPRSASDSSHTGSWMAMLADVRMAWQSAPLTDVERRRVLRYAFLGGKYGQIGRTKSLSLLAEWEGASRGAVEISVLTGAAKIAAAANQTDPGGIDDEMP